MDSKILVAVQFAMIIVIAVLGEVPHTAFTIIVSSAGIILGVVSIYHMKMGNLRILPEPKEGIRFVTTGPYSILRHPMYTSVLLCTISFLSGPHLLLIRLCWLVLLASLVGKIRIEERLLPEIFPDYEEYRKRTRKLVPFIY